MKTQKIVSCLPVAGIGNPYQYLMIKGLNADRRIKAISGVDDRFFGIIRTAIRDKPKYIHFDWITSYYFRRALWMTLLNIPLFICQILIVRYVFQIKLVWTLHNIHPHDAKYYKIHNFCRRFFAKHTNWIRLFSSDSIQRAQQTLNINANFVVCPEGSYVDYYKSSVLKKEARNKLKIEEKDFVYLYLGFIKPYKGIENLIKSFSSLKIINKKLIIAGNVLNENYFKEIYTNNNDISFINKFIENDELQYFYKTADVVVLPFNKVENSGSVILAMGFKKTVIAPKMGVLKKRLKQQNVFLYEDNELQKKLNLAYEKRNQLEEYGLNNFDALKEFSWNDFNKFFK